MFRLASRIAAGRRLKVEATHGAPADRDRHLGQLPAVRRGFAHAAGQRHRGDTSDGHRLAGGDRTRPSVLPGDVIDMDDDEPAVGQGEHRQVTMDRIIEGGFGLNQVDDDLLAGHGDVERPQDEFGIVAGAAHLLGQGR